MGSPCCQELVCASSGSVYLPAAFENSVLERKEEEEKEEQDEGMNMIMMMLLI